MTVRRTGRWQAALAVAVAATLIAGCAGTVTGSAQPAPGAIGIDPSSPSATPSDGGGSSTGSSSPTETSTPDTRPSEPTGSQPSPTGDPSESAPSSTEPPTASTSGSGSGSDDAALYPTAPLQYNKHAKGETSQATVEGRRLAGYVVDVSQVVPEYTEVKLPTMPLKNGDALGLLLTDPVPEVASRAGMYAGFSATRGSKDNTGSMVVAVFELPDAAKAKKGATDLAAAAKGDGDAKLAVPGYPAAAGWSGKGEKEVWAHAFMASGSLVLYAWTSAPPAEQKTLPAILAKYFKLQLAALKDFTPTPQDKLQTLLYDPEGVYSRTLPVAKGNGAVYDGAYSATAMLHSMSSYADDGKLFAEAGVDAVGNGRSTVYRAKDSTGAAKIRDQYYQDMRAKSPDMRDYPLPDSPGIKCLQDSLNASYYCTGAVGRYAFEYKSDSESDVTKSMKSQVAMLTG